MKYLLLLTFIILCNTSFSQDYSFSLKSNIDSLDTFDLNTSIELELCLTNNTDSSISVPGIVGQYSNVKDVFYSLVSLQSNTDSIYYHFFESNAHEDRTTRNLFHTDNIGPGETRTILFRRLKLYSVGSFTIQIKYSFYPSKATITKTNKNLHVDLDYYFNKSITVIN